MKRLLQPSLARRVLLALLAAFLLVWLALIGMDYATFKQQAATHEPIRVAARALAEALEFDDAARAAVIMKATETQYNRLRKNAVPTALGGLLFRLEKRDGTTVYASAPIADRAPPAPESDTPTVRVGAVDYWMVLHDTTHWRLMLLEPAVTDTTALQWLGGNLLQPMLIAFPLVLLPLWFAVRRGLLPLRELVARVASRQPADFSPLGMDLRYAELQPLLAAFNDLLAKSRSGIARERAFVQDAAHELRTPLAVIAAQAHALAGTTDPQHRAQAKAALEHAIERASHLVHQLLTLASLEGGERRAAQAVNLVEIVQKILIDAQPRAAARDIEVSLDSPDRLDVRLDSPAFHSIVENLLNNSLTYAHDGAQVAVRLATDGGMIRLEVADDGPGIATQDLPHIFERFHRGRDVVSPGSGLGLAIVQQAVRQMGGRIDVSPGLEGRGVAFVVSIPQRSF